MKGRPGGFWRGSRVLVTAGPTREPLDPIRFLTNGSTGTMGFSLARAARRLGARVTLVSGPTALAVPRGVECFPVTTAEQMRRRVLARVRRADVFISAAAVGDWRFAKPSRAKIKKGSGPVTLTLIPNPDILAEASRLRARGGRTRPIMVGFALETHRWLDHARLKLQRKGIDLIVANRLDALGGARTRFAVLGRRGAGRRYPSMSKARAAREILACVEREASR